MRVKILSGNAAGGVIDVPQTEGEVLVSTGYAEAVTEEPATDAVAAPPKVDAPSPADDDEDDDKPGPRAPRTTRKK